LDDDPLRRLTLRRNRRAYSVAMSIAVLVFLSAPLGCAGPSLGPVALAPNPMPVAATDPNYVWEQLVDVVDDDFEIQREERIQVFGDFAVEGRIDTFPLVGATYLEPWRRDSVGAYERLESTLQTIRRRALVRVIPDQGTYLVDVAVFKELEDLKRPERSTVGGATFRYDSSLRRLSDPLLGQPVTEGWIPLGRDLQLEQRMLAKIQARLGQAYAGPRQF